MSIYNGPPRGGARGGKDQFSWEAVKADKDREYYLGHSVKALTGRWQKGKDVYWYTREKDQHEGALDNELQAVKQREDQLMAEALGLKPKTSSAQKRKLEDHEMQQLLQRSGKEAGPGEADGDEDNIKGLGYDPRAMGGVAGSAVLEGYDELGAHDRHGRTAEEDWQGNDGAGRESKRSRHHEDAEPSQSRRAHKDKVKDKKHRDKDKKHKKHKKDKREKREKRRSW